MERDVATQINTSEILVEENELGNILKLCGSDFRVQQPGRGFIEETAIRSVNKGNAQARFDVVGWQTFLRNYTQLKNALREPRGWRARNVFGSVETRKWRGWGGGKRRGLTTSPGACHAPPDTPKSWSKTNIFYNNFHNNNN